MRISRHMCGHMRNDTTRYVCTWGETSLEPIEKKINKKTVKWLGHGWEPWENHIIKAR